MFYNKPFGEGKKKKKKKDETWKDRKSTMEQKECEDK